MSSSYLNDCHSYGQRYESDDESGHRVYDHCHGGQYLVKLFPCHKHSKAEKIV